MLKKNGSNLFLLELMFSIFFFIIVATISLKIFSDAHIYNQKTTNLNYSIELIQNEIELFYFEPLGYNDTDIFFDNVWDITNSEANALYTLKKEIISDSDFIILKLTVFELSSDSEIYGQIVKVSKNLLQRSVL